MRFRDAMTGTPIRICKFSGDSGKLTMDDFSVIALPHDNVVTVYSIPSSMLIATFTQSARVLELALSPDGSRLAAALTDHAIILWDVGKKIRVATLRGPSVVVKRLAFSPRNSVLASLSNDGDIILWNGANGEFIASLDVESQKHEKFVFSRDGSRLGSSTHEGSAALWNTENGRLIGVASDVGSIYKLAISDDGSFLAAGQQGTVKLWSGVGESPLPLVDTREVNGLVHYLEFSRDLLAISSRNDAVTLYDFKSRSVLSTFDPGPYSSIVLSPDGTRLASLFDYNGTFKLWDVEAIKATNPASEERNRSNCVTALTLSPDCSQLASGFRDGAVELWDTNHTERATAVLTTHSVRVTVLAFTPDCAQLASGSDDGTVRLWGAGDGSPIGPLEHSFDGSPNSMAFSTDLLAVGTRKSIVLWDYRTIQLVGTLDQGSTSLSFSSGGLLASAYNGDDFPSTSNVTVWNIENRTPSTTFKFDSGIRKLILSPDGSQFYAELARDDFKFFDIATKEEIRYAGNEGHGWAPHLDGILISCQWDEHHGHSLAGWLPDNDGRTTRLWFPRGVDVQAYTVGSSACAVGSHDGRIFLVRPSMTHFN